MEGLSPLYRGTELLCRTKQEFAVTVDSIVNGGWDLRVPDDSQKMNDAPIGEDFNRAL